MIPCEHPPTVLVAEDEAPMRGLLERILKRQDFRVLLASDGEEAIYLYRSNKQEINLVLLDVDLPKIGGLAVFLDMKAQNPDVRVIIVSGCLDQTTKANFSTAGVEHFIAKPYSLGQVVEDVRTSIIENLEIRQNISFASHESEQVD
jgi:two-component system, cell cycle sensor histidine kinase and response regulator CckA